MYKLLSIFLVIATLIACDQDKPTVEGSNFYSLNEAFLLGVGATANCNCDAPSISVLEVIDSRCCALCTCVWEGTAEVVMEVDGQPLRLASNPILNAPAIDTVGNYSIRLIDVTPFPETGEEGEIQTEDYRAEFIVLAL